MGGPREYAMNPMIKGALAVVIAAWVLRRVGV